MYQTATASLKKEYDALFDRFKAQLAEYKVKLKADKDGVAAFACSKWFEKIRGDVKRWRGDFTATYKNRARQKTSHSRVDRCTRISVWLRG